MQIEQRQQLKYSNLKKSSSSLVAVASSRCLKVLVVEDDETQWALWDHIFKTSGITCSIDYEKKQEAAQSLIVLAYESHRPYDLVISDVYLEGDGNGVELWNRYGEAAGKFVFVTGREFEIEQFYKKISFGKPILFSKPISVSRGREIIKDSVP